jgi:signal transduction histidine kinase/CheY-like chemotaxis protein
MRLPDFIEANTKAILEEWVSHARDIWRNPSPDLEELHDHAEDILEATARDMRGEQSPAERDEKARGYGNGSEQSDRLDLASDQHAAQRLDSGFYISEVIGEYRALRASVLRLWQATEPHPTAHDLDDVTRFNESIDQSLAKAIESYALYAERNRKLLAEAQSARMGAESASRAKDDFLATLSHEMRTPLNAIVGWAHIIGADGCSKEELLRGVEVIKRNAAAQVKLIDEVLDVSRIVTGKLQLELVVCDLCAAIESAVDTMRAAAEAKGITVAMDLDAAARAISCDVDRMQQVVRNLLSNAIKFTPKGGQVRISLFREDETSVIRITDTGIGIQPDFLPHVFERFRQAEPSARRSFGGLGLGLSIVKDVVELHGGTVEVHSEGSGLGSTFTVRLPISPAADVRRDELGFDEYDEPAADGETLVRLDGLRVLVVDDEPDARDILVKLLDGVGAKVVAAESADEALDLVERCDGGLDVLVSDLGMPERDGFDLIREVRRRGHHARILPAVALTSYVGKSDRRKALLAGYQVHVSKPVDPADLVAVIASLAGRTGGGWSDQDRLPTL